MNICDFSVGQMASLQLLGYKRWIFRNDLREIVCEYNHELEKPSDLSVVKFKVELNSKDASKFIADQDIVQNKKEKIETVETIVKELEIQTHHSCRIISHRNFTLIYQRDNQILFCLPSLFPSIDQWKIFPDNRQAQFLFDVLHICGFRQSAKLIAEAAQYSVSLEDEEFLPQNGSLPEDFLTRFAEEDTRLIFLAADWLLDDFLKLLQLDNKFSFDLSAKIIKAPHPSLAMIDWKLKKQLWLNLRQLDEFKD